MSSSSSRKDRCVWLGIHKAPPHLSEEAFKASMEKITADWLALPVFKSTILRLEIIFANNLLNAHAKASGMPEPRPIAIVAGEFETPEHIIAIARDPGMARLASAEEFSPERGACVFSAQIGTYIDKPGSKDRAHGIAIHNVPQSMSAEEYKQKSATLLDRCLALPAAQKCLLKCTVWSKYDSDSLESQIQSVGLPVPESDTFVIRFEYENQDRLMELVSDSGTHTIIEAAMKDLNLSQGSYFCADVNTVFERN